MFIYSKENIVPHDAITFVYKQINALNQNHSDVQPYHFIDNGTFMTTLSIMLINEFIKVIKGRVNKMPLPLLIDMVPTHYIEHLYNKIPVF